ncbi:ABC transporter ATP-binding protein [Anaerovorax sp. IOR16]|uniref:ABC transporter ATP-binding protein n=1 Tax=Anaerovorax sp. IOR16 TaxID=2773458 RepID=UPI001FD660F9|nr:ABC transporter ATP-binding protein [Anaerovorax sp. IOR16]
MMGNTILELQGINKYFRDNTGNSFHVIKDVNLSLRQGECIAIVGESGCGKSTLAKLISQLIPVTKGSMFYNGKDVTNLHGAQLKEYYKNVQMIFQNPLSTFSPRMKIGSYMVEPYLNFKLMNKKEALNYAKELLETVGLSKDFIDRYPNELSGGQLQRVVIARTIGLKPDVIICDECTSALDVSIQKQIIHLLLELQSNTKFCNIFITHDLALAESISDKIYVMYLGEIVEILRSKNISRDAKHPYTKALLNAVFSAKNTNKNIEVIKPQIQDYTIKKGCLFALRCPNASENCYREKPCLKYLNLRCSVACNLY